MSTTTISKTKYEELRGKVNRFEKWIDSIRDKRTGWASYKPEDIPADVKPDNTTNEEKSAVELYEFVHDPPERYFLYVKESERIATTWAGEKLGAVLFGREWRDNFGGVRQSIDVIAVNGQRYYGTYYKSAGDYARIRAYKNQ